MLRRLNNRRGWRSAYVRTMKPVVWPVFFIVVTYVEAYAKEGVLAEIEEAMEMKPEAY